MRLPTRSKSGNILYMKVFRGDNSVDFPYLFAREESARGNSVAYVMLTKAEAEAIKDATEDGLFSMWLCIASFQKGRVVYCGGKNETRKK